MDSLDVADWFPHDWFYFQCFYFHTSPRESEVRWISRSCCSHLCARHTYIYICVRLGEVIRKVEGGVTTSEMLLRCSAEGSMGYVIHCNPRYFVVFQPRPAVPRRLRLFEFPPLCLNECVCCCCFATETVHRPLILQLNVQFRSKYDNTLETLTENDTVP